MNSVIDSLRSDAEVPEIFLVMFLKRWKIPEYKSNLFLAEFQFLM